MYLTDMLRKLGDRIGIIELSSASSQPSAPQKIQTRTITLAELVTHIQVSEVRELAELPAELSAPFDDVYHAAGIQTPPSGWTVDRLEQFLKSSVQGLNRSDAQRETLRALAAAGVDSAEVIKDAVSRDQALDAFEERIQRKRELWIAAKKQLLSALATQIRGLEEEQRRVTQEIAAEEKSWMEWKGRKIQCEKDMAHAVGYLIDKPVISTESE